MAAKIAMTLQLSYVKPMNHSPHAFFAYIFSDRDQEGELNIRDV
jgi:hypothetical protein